MVGSDVLWWTPLLRQVRRLQHRRQLGYIHLIQGLVELPVLLWVISPNLDPH